MWKLLKTAGINVLKVRNEQTDFLNNVRCWAGLNVHKLLPCDSTKEDSCFLTFLQWLTELMPRVYLSQSVACYFICEFSYRAMKTLIFIFITEASQINLINGTDNLLNGCFRQILCMHACQHETIHLISF